MYMYLNFEEEDAGRRGLDLALGHLIHIDISRRVDFDLPSGTRIKLKGARSALMQSYNYSCTRDDLQKPYQHDR